MNRVFGRPSRNRTSQDTDYSEVPQERIKWRQSLQRQNRKDNIQQYVAGRAERQLAKRLAVIDHLRDVAEENGNIKLLERTDELEELAREEFARKTEGGDLNWIAGSDSSDTSDDSTPVDITPEESTPEESAPEESAPEESTPVESTPEEPAT